MPSIASPPRYVALARQIAAEIAEGQHPLGSQLLPEVEMAAERGVSRATMRAALDRLEGLGLISRRRRAGTRVAALQPADRGVYQQSLAGVGDLLQYAAQTRREIISLKPVVSDGPMERELGLRAGQRWLQITSLRVPADSGAALCWTETYAGADVAPADLEQRLRGAEAAELIATVLATWSGRPITEVVQEIKATGIPAGPVARALGVKAGEHALEITRRYLDSSGAPLSVSISLHPAGRFTSVSRLRRAAESSTRRVATTAGIQESR
ncbi:GntR family transcriptional regulator [Muricoccus nepalensis]|nr:GntR family transcriptional regulator [Roseomonas nepalensis]